jgi:hypothetical protein
VQGQVLIWVKVAGQAVVVVEQAPSEAFEVAAAWRMQSLA